MASELDQIRRLLAEQQVSSAVQATLDWFSGSEPVAVAGALGAALRPLTSAGEGPLVSAFLKQLESFIDMPVIEAIRKGLDESPAEATAWAEKLPPVTQERLARECRDAIRLKQFPLALERAKLILAYRIGGQPAEARAQLLGSVLGSLENMPRETEALWGMVESHWSGWGLSDALRHVAISARKARLDSLQQRRYEAGETEWTRLLTELALTLKGELPRPNQLGEASEEDIARFLTSARGLVAAALASPRRISMIDAMWILAEYTPRQTASTAQRAGIEQRVHGTLGPRAQQAVAEAFRRLAEIEGLRQAVLETAARPVFDRHRDMALDLMGALEWPGFADAALSILRDRGLVAHHMNAISAIGACGGAKALDLLSDTIRAHSGRVINGNERRVVIKCLDAMERVIRRHDITGPPRDVLLTQVIRAVPKDDTRLLMGIASRLCLHRIEAMSPAMQDWAVKQLVAGLWRPDTTPTWARPTDVEQVRRRPLGPRQGLANALIRLGPHALPTLHAFLMGADARVSGAYVAAAEVLGKIADSSSTGPLEAMLRSVLMAKDEALSGEYSEEMVFDEEAGQMVPLSRDKLAASVLEALVAIGTPEALDVCWRLRQQIEMRHVASLGKFTAGVLTRLPPQPESGARRGSLEELRAAQDDDGPPTSALIADLRGGGFLGFGAEKARVRKVAALQALSQRLALEALEAMASLLTDKDLMVRASAKTALLSFAAPSAPLAVREAFVQFVLSELGDGQSVLREPLLALLHDVNTTLEPWASRLDALLKTNPTGALRASLAHLRRSAGGFEASDETSSAKPSAALSKIELRRQYLEARRAWIAAGKQGPPPEPPEGLDLG